MCVGVHLCTRTLSLQVHMYIFTYRHTEFAWVCVCMYL